MTSHREQAIVVTLWAPDPQAILPFYTKTLRLPRQDAHGGVANFRVGAMWLVLMRGEPRKPLEMGRDPWPIFAWSSPDYTAIRADLEGQGVAILEESPAGEAHEWFMFADPAGNVLELVNGAGPSS